MRLALLGIDADTLALARSATESGRHQVVYACEADAHADQVRAVAPLAKLTGPWEFLLGTASVDAVLLARGEEELRGEQLRKLVQESVPLLVAHPVLDSMLVYYEVDMIRQASRGVVLPYLPARWHPAVLRLAELAGGTASSIGSAQQIVFERTQADRSRSGVLAQFARDVDPLRTLCGELTKVAAMASPGGEGYANLGVQLSGQSSVLVRWSVGPMDSAVPAAPSQPSASFERAVGGALTLVGTMGKAVLHMPHDQPWSLETYVGGRADRQSFPDWNPASLALARLEEALGGADVRPGWGDAAKSVELAEAVGRSVVKGRTVELHNEELSEQGTFKGIMTSLGCGLLLVTLVVLVAAGTLAHLFKLSILDYVPHVIAAILGLFLLIQSLKLVFPPEKST